VSKCITYIESCGFFVGDNMILFKRVCIQVYKLRDNHITQNLFAFSSDYSTRCSLYDTSFMNIANKACDLTV
jgi:hypothetical protein